MENTIKVTVEVVGSKATFEISGESTVGEFFYGVVLPMHTFIGYSLGNLDIYQDSIQDIIDVLARSYVRDVTDAVADSYIGGINNVAQKKDILAQREKLLKEIEDIPDSIETPQTVTSNSSHTDVRRCNTGCQDIKSTSTNIFSYRQLLNS